jgi:hypothetical protein
MKAVSSSKTNSKRDPHQWIARAVSAEMEAEAARKLARLAKDKYKQARKVFKEARRKAKQARKKAKSAARSFGASAGKAKRPQWKSAISRTPIKAASQKAVATPLRSSSPDQLNHAVPPAPAPTPPSSTPAP